MLYAFCWHWLFSLSTIFLEYLQSVDSFSFFWPSVLVDLHRLFNLHCWEKFRYLPVWWLLWITILRKMNIYFFLHLSLLGFCFVLRLKSHCNLALLSCSSCLILSAGIVELFNHAYFPHLLINFGYHFISSNYLGSILEYFHNKHTIKITYIPILSNFSWYIY